MALTPPVKPRSRLELARNQPVALSEGIPHRRRHFFLTEDDEPTVNSISIDRQWRRREAALPKAIRKRGLRRLETLELVTVRMAGPAGTPGGDEEDHRGGQHHERDEVEHPSSLPPVLGRRLTRYVPMAVLTTDHADGGEGQDRSPRASRLGI